ncbi:Neurogenic locus notch-like protein protein 2 [Larimichthys crocea]|uniref:Uncharacterized protein n=1 Tax=Larimichthys crocea TaxID=215358 RepID=A0ACD3RMY7_LARCR|nr:Neurogenic locus notch-like protein protein 2 [Larimichthys crocea]
MLASLRNGGGPDCSLHGEEEEDSGGEEPGPSVISDLITQGASLMAQTDRTGETALHLAARYARADAAKRLLDAGADPNAHDNMGRTPLHAAVAADAQGVFQILIRNRATELDSRMNDGTTPLILAARLAVEGMVEELIHCHADINAVDDHGKSALHWAAAVNNVEATLVLLKNGANRDMQDNKEETPLFLAAREGSFEAAQVLLDHYSNRDITDHLDRLPRDTAQERMHHDIVRLLDQYNLVHSPHNGPNHMGGGGNSVMCGANGAGFIGMRPGPQGKKSRRGGGGAKVGGVGGGAKELKDMKAKRRKKPAGGDTSGVVAGVGGGSTGGAGGGSANGVKAAGLPESSVTMSPVDSLESPHSYTGDVSGTVSTTGKLASAPYQPDLQANAAPCQPHAGTAAGLGRHDEARLQRPHVRPCTAPDGWISPWHGPTSQPGPDADSHERHHEQRAAATHCHVPDDGARRRPGHAEAISARAGTGHTVPGAEPESESLPAGAGPPPLLPEYDVPDA